MLIQNTLASVIKTLHSRACCVAKSNSSDRALFLVKDVHKIALFSCGVSRLCYVGFALLKTSFLQEGSQMLRGLICKETLVFCRWLVKCKNLLSNKVNKKGQISTVRR